MKDPSITSLAFERMARRWALPQALMGGSLALQAAGTRYLPRHPAEHGRTYAERARRSVLRNYFRRTVQKLTGRVFAEPLIIDAATPPALVALLQNMDMMGRGLNVFARDWFQDALVNGLSHVLVDFPAQSEGGSRARPYAVHVTADQLIAAQWDIHGEDKILTQIRIREKATDCQGFEEREVAQIRVLERDNWSLYRAMTAATGIWWRAARTVSAGSRWSLCTAIAPGFWKRSHRSKIWPFSILSITRSAPISAMRSMWRLFPFWRRPGMIRKSMAPSRSAPTRC